MPRLALLLCSALALPAAAQSRRSVAFLGLRTLGIDAGESDALGRAAARSLAERRELVTGSADDRARTCKGEARCYCEAARAVPAAGAVFGNVGRIGDIYTFELVLVDTGNCSIESSVFVSEPHDLESAPARLEQLVLRLVTPAQDVSATAVKSERDVSRVPATVTVITARDIELLGITSLAELFTLMPGFEVNDINSGADILHHGLAATMLFMIDGLPVTMPLWSIMTLERDFHLSLASIERVEVVHGPGSVVWGGNALLGIVNLITKSAARREQTLGSHVRWGSEDNQEIHAAVDANHEWYSYVLATTWARGKGARTRVRDSLLTDVSVDEPLWGNAGVTQPRYDVYYDVLAKLQLYSKLRAEILHTYFKNYFQISPIGSLLSADLQGVWEKRHLLVSLALADRLGDALSYELTVSRQEISFWEKYVLYRPSEPEPYGVIAEQGNELEPQVIYYADARLEHRLDAGIAANHLLLGGSYLYQELPNMYVSWTAGSDQGEPALDLPASTASTRSGYLQDELAVLDGGLILSGGLRYDAHQPYRSVLNKQGAVIIGGSTLRTKLMYAEGFRPPDFNSLYSRQAGVLGNLDLRPERSRALSAEVDWSPREGMKARAGGSVGSIYDLIIYAPYDGPLPDVNVQPQNRERTELRTAFAELRLYPSSTLSGFATYSAKWLYDCSGEPGAGCEPSQSPVARHTASLAMSWRPSVDVNLFASVVYVGTRTARFEAPGVDEGSRRLHPYALADLGFTLYNVLAEFDVTIELRNPFGTVHQSPYLLDGDPSSLIERRVSRELLATLAWSE